MISLGAITLSDELRLEGEFNDAVSSLTVNRAISGRLVIQKGNIIKGRQFVLSATRSGNQYSGSFTRLQVESLKDYAQNNTQITFVYGSQTHEVLIMPGSIQVVPLLDYGDEFQDTDLYTGTITLLEV